MAEADRPVPNELKGHLTGLANDAGRLLALRCELARQELAADAASVRRLAIAAVVAVALAVLGAVFSAVAVARWLERWLGGAAAAWLLAGGLVLLLSAVLCGWLAWRRFRRELVALAGSRAELREDLVWLQEWIERLD